MSKDLRNPGSFLTSARQTTVELWIGKEPDTAHERRSLDRFMVDMDSRFGHSGKLYLILSDYYIDGRQIDLTVLKRDAIIIIELKECDAPFKASENGKWLTPSGHLIGSRGLNPFQQTRQYRERWKDFLERNRDSFRCLSTTQNDRPFWGVTTIVTISPSLHPDTENNIKHCWWFKLCGLNELGKAIEFETNKWMDFSDEELRRLASQFLSLKGPINKCPNCGYERQPGDTECPRCGTVYKKSYVVKKQAEEAIIQQGSKRTKGERKRKFYIIALIIALVLISLSVSYLYFRSQYSNEQAYRSIPTTTQRKNSPKKIYWKDAASHYGEYCIVEGNIVYTRKIGTLYLNFSFNWKEDFTAVIYPKRLRQFPTNPEDYYRGKKVRVKGTIERHETYDKPQIIINSPDQIEIIN